jgi:hypothetical protein
VRTLGISVALYPFPYTSSSHGIALPLTHLKTGTKQEEGKPHMMTILTICIRIPCRIQTVSRTDTASHTDTVSHAECRVQTVKQPLCSVQTALPTDIVSRTDS